MSIKSTLIDLAVVAAIVGASFAGGYVKGTAVGMASEGKQILAAQQDAQTAKDNASKANQALTDIRSQLALEKQLLLDAQQAATKALDQRDQVNAQLAKATAARIAAERKLANETPDCSNLQHLPICPELARRLFGEPAKALSPAAAANNGH